MTSSSIIISWADFIAMYWDRLDAEHRKSYLLDMKQGKNPPPLENVSDLEGEDKALMLRRMGSAVRKRREERGVRQDQLAKLMGHTKGHLSQQEAGVKPFSISDLLFLMKILGIKPQELFLPQA